jgi:hypothetical protein
MCPSIKMRCITSCPFQSFFFLNVSYKVFLSTPIHFSYSILNYDFRIQSILSGIIQAPWIPKIKSTTDVSNFDPYPGDDHHDTGAVDTGTWDKNF